MDSEYSIWPEPPLPGVPGPLLIYITKQQNVTELFWSLAGQQSQPFAFSAAGDLESTHLNKPTAMTGHFSNLPRI